MATSSIVVASGAAEAASKAVAAVTGAGGKISSQLPGQPVRFTIKGRDGDGWIKRITGYAGVAHVAPGNPGQTRVDVAVRAREIDVAVAVIGSTVFVLAVGFMPTPWPMFNLIWILVGLAWIAYQSYLQFSMWPQEHLDRIVAALVPATGTAWGSVESQHSMGSDATEQLKKLGELRAAGVLTDAEFNSKKAELLKRI